MRGIGAHGGEHARLAGARLAITRPVAALLAVCAALACIFPLFACAPDAAPGTGEEAPPGAADADGRAGERPASAPGASAASSRTAIDSRLDQVVQDYAPLPYGERSAISAERRDYADNVGELFQLPLMPSGCEVVSLTIALNSMGVSTRLTEIADNYIVVDGDHEWGFIASSYSESGGGFPPAIARAANDYLADRGSDFRAHDLTGSGFEGIEALVDAGYPVLVWTTLRLTEPVFDEESEWYINEHCVVMYAVDGDTVYASNPIDGYMAYDRDTFADIYGQCGSRALYIR